MASEKLTTIAIIGTCDTKLDELLYIRNYILALARPSPVPIHAILIDIGRKSSHLKTHADIITSIASFLPTETEYQSRNDLIPTIGKALKSYLLDSIAEDSIHGVLAIGGSCGSSIVAEALQSLPFGFPKLLLSTMASGDIKPYIGCSDTTVMYSVVDIAGLNNLLKTVLQNAASAIVGMVSSKVAAIEVENENQGETPTKKKIAMTMFGITTPACDTARKYLEENGCEVYVFHATGSGGMAMEKLILEGAFDGVLDLTTTELADEAFGGVLSAGSERLKGAVKTQTPTIISIGALDCINFGPKDTLPERYEDRLIHVHNSAVTLVRTNEEENKHLGEVISARIKENLDDDHVKKVQVWLPLKSVSIIDQEGAVFRDEPADKALHESIKSGLSECSVKVHEEPLDINDPQFAKAVARSLLAMIDQ
ncbi:hypothetical protein TWF694_001546 [Orbilia ellipsospora]|uniref:Uncharacterized protein n=1 Tax=Orbilia ellipsospora TaxID=2528407 RepID=A0AAV9XTS6_9PEZI